MTQRRIGDGRNYPTKWEQLADTTKARFSCVQAITTAEGRVHSLWHGRLPDGKDLLILSINRPEQKPAYDRGFSDREEALGFFSRFMPAGAA